MRCTCVRYAWVRVCMMCGIRECVHGDGEGVHVRMSMCEDMYV